jgi:hypothetical protein
MDWQHDTDALAVAGGRDYPVRAVGEEYRLGGAAHWHGKLTTAAPAASQDLLDAVHLVLRLPGGWEGAIRPLAPATGNRVRFHGADTPRLVSPGRRGGPQDGIAGTQGLPR